MINNSRNTYMTPYDDAQQPLLEAIVSAQKTIRMADYSFNLAPVVQALIAAKNRGVDVQVVLDKSQSKGSTEVPEIKALVSGGITPVIGESDKDKIMHLKVCIVDDSITCSGSYNYTGTADLEDNFEDIETNSDRAAAFTAYWQKVHDYCASQPQPTV